MQKCILRKNCLSSNGDEMKCKCPSSEQFKCLMLTTDCVAQNEKHFTFATLKTTANETRIDVTADTYLWSRIKTGLHDLLVLFDHRGRS